MSTPTLEEIVPLLKKRRPDGKGGYTALCPAHDDHTPSLSIRKGDRQPIIAKCQSRGCSYKDIMTAFGFGGSTTRDTPPSIPYEYHDENGRPLYREVRLQPLTPKRFIVESYGVGGWTKGMGGVQVRVPYRLPELLEAIALEKIIYIVEGAKDAETARTLGLTATTNILGAGKWSDDLSKHFKDADVVILPDNDPVGRDHAASVARSLGSVARRVRTVRLPGLEEKGDLTDWVCAGHTLSELQDLVQSAPEASGECAIETEADEMGLATCALNAPPMEPQKYLVKDLVIEAEPHLVFGDGGSFKTAAALHLVCAVAGGRAAFGKFDATKRPVLVISAEDPANVITSRMKAMCRGHGWDEAEVLGNIHYYALNGVTLSRPEWYERILSEVKRLNVGLVVLDNFQELVEGEQNSASEMAPYIKRVRGLCQPTNAAVILIHHAGKAGKEKRSIDRIRGTTAIHGAVRAAYFVSSSDNDIRIECVKNNRGEKLRPFVVQATIDSEPDNRLNWTTARFDYVSVRQADFDKARGFVLDQLRQHGRMNTTELKDAAIGTGVNQLEVSNAIKTLETTGAIDFENGPKNSKLWGIKQPSLVAEANGQPEQECLPSAVSDCRATTEPAARWLPPPLGGNQAGSNEDTSASSKEAA